MISFTGRPSFRGAPVSPLDLEMRGRVEPCWTSVLTRDALEFVARLERRFRSRRERLLRRRRELQARLDRGWRPGFLPKGAPIREGDWTVAPLPSDLGDRRVEVLGPPDREGMVRALNSGANVFLADFEDAIAPTWSNLLEGQANLREAVSGTIAWRSPEGTPIRLAERTAALAVRPRGLHLEEGRLLVDGRPVSASFFDFGLFAFHNAGELCARGSGPYFTLPKLEGRLEARLWNDVFDAAEADLGLRPGSIRATLLVETVPAAFEMEEMLYELRRHAAGLGLGSRGYLFSFVKRFRSDPHFVLPERARVGMDRPFLEALSHLLVRTCHRRGAPAIGGIAAEVPVEGDPDHGVGALEELQGGLRRQADLGFDGTWVAHPDFVGLAREAFGRAHRGPERSDRPAGEVRVSPDDLLAVPPGAITEAGLRQEGGVALRYLEAWLRGVGRVPVQGRMEDAAAAEICRAQLWQWIRHGARLEDGRRIDAALVGAVLRQETDAIRASFAEERYVQRRFETARGLLEQLVTSPQFEEFLTIPASRLLEEDGWRAEEAA